MSNPRKFSEKIAVQLQRQAEATAVIDEVLRDIREVTQTRGTNAFRQPIPQDRPSNHLQPQFPYPRGSSLPNISQMSANPVSTEYSNVHGFTLSHVPEGAQAILQVDCQHIPNHRRGGGGPLRHSPTDKRIVSSPYGSLINHGTYLSPPLESTWARRASSDSALHQTSMGPDQSLPGILCTSSSSRTCPKRGHPQPMEIVGKSPVHSFPRTSSQQSNTSGLHLGRVEIMEGEAGKNSTMGMGMGEPGGSLPDLTSIHMPSPLTTPIDVDLDCQNPRGSQSYNPSPVGPSSPLTFGSQNNYGGNGRFMVGQVSPSSNQSDDIVVRRNANLPPLRTPQGTGMCGNGTKPEAFHGASPSGTPTYTQSQLPLTMISSSPPASTVSGYRVNTSPSSPSGRGSTPQSPHSSAGSPYSAGAPPSPVTTSTAPQMFFSLPHSVSVSISSSALPSSSHQQQTISLQQHLEQCKMNDANSTPSSLPLHYPRGYVAQQARQQGNEDDLRARRIALLLRNRALNTLRGLRAPFPLRRLPPLIDDVFPHQQIPQEGGAEEVIVEQPDSNPESVQVSDMLNELRTQVRILMDSIRNSVIDEEVMPVILSSLERSEAALGRAIQRYEVLMERLQRHQAARLSSALHLFRSLQAEFRHLVDSRDTSASGMRLARFHVSMTTRLIDLIIVLLQARSHLDVMQQSMQGNHDGENEDPIRVQFDGDRESHDGEEPEEITIEVPLPALRRPPLVRQNPVIADEVDDVDIARAPRDLPNLVPIGGIGGGGIVSHRIQMWDLSPGHPLPPIHLQEKNVVIKCCQLYNDASIDISSDGNMLVAISQDCGYPRLSVFRVHSLRLEDLGVCLHVFHTRVNAVSIGFSPLSRYIIIGLENRRPLFQIDDDNGPAVMALLLKLTTPEEGKTEKSMTIMKSYSKVANSIIIYISEAHPRDSGDLIENLPIDTHKKLLVFDGSDFQLDLMVPAGIKYTLDITNGVT
ncbi:unnamed protein product, partial [Darwinula stevensoni]